MKINRIIIIVAVMASLICLHGRVSQAADSTVPGDFATIQAAIDDSGTVDGDTITVLAGTYTENLELDKQLTIQGAGSGSTTIDASTFNGAYVDGITVLSGDVTIQNLSITSANYNANANGIYVRQGGTNVRSNITFNDVIITGSNAHGVRLDNSISVDNLQITNCQFTNNAKNGLNSESNTVLLSMLISKSNLNQNKYGLYLEGTISNVTISDSTFNDSVGGYGGYMTETGPLTGLEIQNCEFNNNVVGLMVWNVQDNADITISGCSFQDNDKWGALIWGNTLTNVLVECSSVLNNDGLGTGYYGIDFFTYDEAMNNVAVHDTNISGHTVGGGIKNRNEVATAIVDGTENWWGDSTGPFHLTLNPAGLGDAVFEGPINNVNFYPWLLKLANCDVIPVNIDIKPGHCPNILKLKEKKKGDDDSCSDDGGSDDSSSGGKKKKSDCKIAILGTLGFDVTTIDVTTLNINGVSPVKSKVKDVTAPSVLELCDCEKLPKDTYKDLELKFNSQALIATLGAVQDGEVKELTLTGNLFDGTPIEGKDCVVIKIKGKDDGCSDDDSGSGHKKKKHHGSDDDSSSGHKKKKK